MPRKKGSKAEKQIRVAKTEWQWLKRYRVWDANRKIFVYPENWIEPEQRVPAILRASLLGIAAVICPDCYIKTKRTRVPKPAQLRGVRLLFLSKNQKGALAAGQLLAEELGRDLYRVDLREVVSKYIGETEKNLSFVFSAARKSDATPFLRRSGRALRQTNSGARRAWPLRRYRSELSATSAGES